ncbi:protein arginine kinase [Petroclostridium sp. X23]|uniref:protein arginine kinase n=1 Tax=Petroclostridium sp. X23 TaxID=3045146 RepID=UPI0024AD63A8|nr:protein arginine kinase [Petroclostridium sp. X23]WHH58409.1 protein arginine kinase [Petroclostridium sp. X23]
MTAWHIEKGPEWDVVISSRIRLARNFMSIPFPVRMNREQGEQVIKECKDAIFASSDISSNQFKYVSMAELNAIDKQVMVEKHLISPQMLQDVHSRAAILSSDEKISIMLNEEDHLRIQCLFPGMQLDAAYDLSNKIDDLIEENVEYAYSENYGYLTSCPTNVGTGMRASVMVHLPALTITGYIHSILSAVNKLGITVRGLYGEGSEARGNIFQISNQVTLGMSEQEALENLKSIINQVIEQERAARKNLLKNSRLKLEDRLYRSYGIFSNARVITSEEFMKLLSDVRLGVNLGIMNHMALETLNELMIETQPASIMKRYGEDLSPEERDMKRAELIREKIS